MTTTNQYLPFATGPSANALTPAAYSLLTSLISTGFTVGEADAQQVNTILRQATVAASALAQFASVNAGADALDNGDRDALALLIKQAVEAVAGGAGNLPVGMVAGFLDSTVRPGWLELNGQPVSRTTYAALFAYLGETYGPGDGVTTFNLPDARGEFLRGWDHGRGLDPDSLRSIGSTQGDMLRAHSHSAFRGQAVTNTSTGGIGGDNPYSGTTGEAGGAETRPHNMAIMYCIKY